MNTINQLVEQNQEIEKQKRLVKGEQIYKSGLVSQLENNLFIIKDKYVVEDISTEMTDKFVCSCPDFQYRVNIDFCKHIFAVILAKLDKQNNNGIGA